MSEILYSLFPSFPKLLPSFIKAIGATLQMVLYTSVVAFVLGIIFGVLLIVTKKDGILQNLLIYNIIDKSINVIRSIPFIILMVMLFPLSKVIVGTTIGVKGAIVPLVCGTVPFFARQIETAIAEVDYGLIEASQAMGCSPLEIIFKVYLRESIPSIVRVSMVTMVNLIGLTAMAGALGSGGIGDFAIRHGHQGKLIDMVYASVIVILILVTIVQFIGNLIIKKTTH